MLGAAPLDLVLIVGVSHATGEEGGDPRLSHDAIVGNDERTVEGVVAVVL
jgi:hypothetical protein